MTGCVTVTTERDPHVSVHDEMETVAISLILSLAAVAKLTSVHLAAPPGTAHGGWEEGIGEERSQGVLCRCAQVPLGRHFHW